MAVDGTMAERVAAGERERHDAYDRIRIGHPPAPLTIPALRLPITEIATSQCNGQSGDDRDDSNAGQQRSSHEDDGPANTFFGRHGFPVAVTQARPICHPGHRESPLEYSRKGYSGDEQRGSPAPTMPPAQEEGRRQADHRRP